jgi:hypothetical protein
VRAPDVQATDPDPTRVGLRVVAWVPGAVAGLALRPG